MRLPSVVARRSAAVPPTFGLARCLLGAGMLAAPDRLARGLGTDRVTARDTGWLTRMIGGRELALGVGTLIAVRRSQGLAGWLYAQALADAGDAVALAGALRAGVVSPVRAGPVLAAALAGIAADLVAAREWARRA